MDALCHTGKQMEGGGGVRKSLGRYIEPSLLRLSL